MQDCAYIVSHGGYPSTITSFRVPCNIRLIQISKPRHPIYTQAVKQILQNKCNINAEAQTFYYLTNKGIFKNETYKVITKPNETTTDIRLGFNEESIDGIQFGIHWKGMVIRKKDFIANNGDETKLSDLLDYLSVINRTGKPLDVYSVNCRSGSYIDACFNEVVVNEDVINELARDFGHLTTNVGDDIQELPSSKDITVYKVSTNLNFIFREYKKMKDKKKSLKKLRSQSNSNSRSRRFSKKGTRRKLNNVSKRKMNSESKRKMSSESKRKTTSASKEKSKGDSDKMEI